MTPVNLAQKLTLFDSCGAFKHVSARANSDIMAATRLGKSPSLRHKTFNDFALTLEGETIMDYEGVDPVIVPEGHTHRPRAKAKATVLLIAPHGNPNSGDRGKDARANNIHLNEARYV
ncbi:mannose-6-phosphate isomerase [Celeribacter sp.]|uniref:mannose-6-phosphate isomerase n=1 Tax=Celeribacter sp. TaxID=1890673 RepID=UPI003A8DA5C0